jgi:tetrapyrrole methylase family protein/MazG family protein
MGMKSSVKVVGLGPGSWRHLTLEAIDAVRQTDRLFLRTEKHPVIGYLKDSGIAYQALDRFYQTGSTFELEKSPPFYGWTLSSV